MEHARLIDQGLAAVTHALAGHAPGIAVLTSGSTGQPREILLSGDAIRASALATLERLGGPGHWLLTVPSERIAGAMVAARAQLGGGQLIHSNDHPFTAGGFAAAVGRLPTGRRYVSLVPTQLRRLLAGPEGADALASFDAVLVGGAPPGMALPANTIETYGMTETSGGCVYNGVPLDGVSVRIGTGGHVEIAGPMLADGYADGDNSAFTIDGGTRWLRTSDAGTWDGHRLTVHGRTDDILITGGHNVHPAAVEHALLQRPDIADAVVTSVPDLEWGEKIVALVVVAGADAPALAQLHSELVLPRHALPRAIVSVSQVPRTNAGKIDREAARELALRNRDIRGGDTQDLNTHSRDTRDQDTRDQDTRDQDTRDQGTPGR